MYLLRRLSMFLLNQTQRGYRQADILAHFPQICSDGVDLVLNGLQVQCHLGEHLLDTPLGRHHLVNEEASLRTRLVLHHHHGCHRLTESTRIAEIL
jgi:hypothetical protein